MTQPRIVFKNWMPILGCTDPISKLEEAQMEMSDRKNEGKLEWCLMPFEAVAEIVKVLSDGARKYSVGNWEKGCPWTDTYNSLLRHLVSWRSGEDRDQESGHLHLAHAGCNLVFLIMYTLKGWGKDDRKQPILRNVEEKSCKYLGCI